MRRSRAQEDGTPGELTSHYYTQRASMGFIITEGIQPSDDGQGYLRSRASIRKSILKVGKRLRMRYMKQVDLYLSN
ncbi:hypothetical protein [Paenibacillus mucilaginosus]|uniref:hypothetical protein n=1 Tax=Paenibacillus mucilaginosus TaxID=61624 RepID=UPI003D217B31